MAFGTWGTFPAVRMRRRRQNAWIRRLTEETTLLPKDFILPLFLQEGRNLQTPVPSMAGVFCRSIDLAVEEAKKAYDHGIAAVALFPRIDPKKKTPQAEEACNPDNLICRALGAFKKELPHLGLIADVALDPFNSDGHDGLVQKGVVRNDETVEILAKQALVQAQAGADILAPSDMMDGRIEALRRALDEKGFTHTLILSYAAKYASAFYGPFRDAVGAGTLINPQDKKTYQMNPANRREALEEIALDLREGADMVMIKPALAYLDVLAEAARHFTCPLYAYQVSGEYALLAYGGQKGLIDYEKALMESLLSIKRAGAMGILTYGAIDAVRILSEA